MTFASQEALLVNSFEEYSRRVSEGQRPNPKEYASSLGGTYSDFLDAIEAKEALEELIEPSGGATLPDRVGPYDIVKLIGRGAIGVVYEARHRKLDRRVALKMLHGPYVDHEDKLRQFDKEARLCAKVSHPHLVDMRDAGRFDGLPYCVMELVEGKSLKEHIASDPLPPGAELFRQFAGIADGLELLHTSKVIHRDVKPSNIMVDESGVFVLTDFGLARSELEPSFTRTGQTIGTLPYMSPELVVDSKSDEGSGRRDVYALGITMYEVLAGKPPFRARSLPALVMAIRHERAKDLSEVARQVSKDCEHVVMKAISKEPSDRYEGAAEMRDDLYRLAAGEPVLGRPPTNLRLMLRKLRRLAPLAAALVLMAIGGLAWHQQRPAEASFVAFVPARVLVAGVHRGETPLALQLDPGEHQISYERKRFRPINTTVTLVRGDNRVRPAVLLPLDMNDEVAVAELLKHAGYEDMCSFRDPAHRGPSANEPLAALPRGRVLVRDLGELLFERTEEHTLPDGCRWEMRRGSETLLDEPASVEEYANRLVVPQKVKERLKPGDRVSWAIVTPKGRRYEQEFVIAEEGRRLRQELERLARMLKGQPAAFRASILAEAYLRHDLPHAALATTQRAGAMDTGRKNPNPAILLGMTMRALWMLDLESAQIAEPVVDQLDALSDDVREGWFSD